MPGFTPEAGFWRPGPGTFSLRGHAALPPAPLPLGTGLLGTIPPERTGPLLRPTEDTHRFIDVVE
ncbi:hypothetical protein ARTSIC4J27_394 [Pseudarthrobacter siccitolerans]|uniref:Uncharacterized protein n=1 Tax=Pseudarthrobacter siccitolerans TaxID=861266 RepID=A0A024GXM0_9MICC|nr:hypothetical protein ARTSIC4J27_394 [Pseudarthrobacter siccitolerans]